jgi:threonine dehydrogenase-like Zn-dependent dehydrogenase
MLENQAYQHSSTSAAGQTQQDEISFVVPDQMRALVLDGTGFEHLKMRQVPTPRPGPQQLLARVDAAGICTSNIKLVEQGPNHNLIYGWDISRFPLILGDEGSVTLVRIGEELCEHYRPGERYVIQPAVDHPPINHRERYRNNGQGIEKVAVSYTLPGHLAEYILITEETLAGKCLVPLPDTSLPYAHVALSEPLSCVISGQDHHLHLSQEGPLAPRSVLKGLKPGGVTVIVGCGAMGRMHVDLALSYRPRALVASDLIDSRLETVRRLFGPRAEKLGIALHAVNPGQTDVEGLVNELTDFRGADDVIVAVGSAKAIEMAQHHVGRGAVFNLFGGLKKGQDVVGLDTGLVHYKEINVTGSSGGSPWDIARTLELMVSGDIDAGAHITQIGDLEHAIQFLEMVKAQEIDGKAVVYPHRRTGEMLHVHSWTAEDERAYLAAGAS